MTKPVGNAAASPSRAAFLPRRTAAGSGRRFGRGARVPAAVLAAVFAAGLPAAGQEETRPTVSIDSPSVAEGDSGSTTLTYGVTLSATSTGIVMVGWSDSGNGSATSGTDYAAVDGATLTFQPGESRKTIAVSVTGDGVDEPDETILMTLGEASGATIGTGTGTGTITDDDAAPTVTLSLADDSISENGGSTTVSATLSHASSEATTITIEAVADAYTVGSDGTITIAAGDTANASDTATINAVDNDTGEADRSVSVTGSASNTQGIGQVTGASLTLEDDDGGEGPTGPSDSEPTVSIDSPSVAEGAAGTTATLTFTVSLDAASDGEVTVDYAEGTGGTAASGTDYTAPAAGTLTFAAGDTSRSIAVSVTGDGVDEPDETVVVTLGNASGATVGSGTGTGTITDDDAAPTVTLALADDSISENGGSTTVSATLSHPSSEATTITISAVANAYTVGADGTITIAAGDTANVSDTATITAVDNDTGEADRSVSVTGSAGNTQGIGQVTGASLTLEDDDGGAGPTGPSDAEPTVSINSPSVAEGAAGTTATLTFTVSLSAASDGEVTVDYAEGTGGTAASGTDYTAPASGTLTFAVGDTSKSITVSVTGDATDEPDETVVVTLGNASGATVGSGTGTGTITDDDAAPTVTLALADASISENGGTTTVSATLSHPSSAATIITITPVANAYEVGSLAVGLDATITIAAGSTANPSDTAAITAVDNAADEANRSVTVTGSASNTQGIGRVTGASLTLVDDDGEPSLAINAPSVTEGDSGSASLNFTVTLSPASAGEVTVDYAEGTGGTAVSGTDYTAPASGTLTFAAGDTSKTITVSVTGDSTDEPDETVVVTLGNASGAVVGAGTGTGTITDDDAAPTVTLALADDSISENGGSTTVSATLSHPSSEATTITIEAVANAYTVGADATITIAAGDTANASDTATINAVAGDTGEADRSVSVTGSASNTQGIGRVTGASLTLEDDDGGAGPTGPSESEPTMSIDSPSVSEGAAGTTATLTFTVSLSAASTQAVTVDYAEATGGTATAGTDYTAPASGTLTIAAGDTGATIAVTVTGDGVDEPDETILMTLGEPAGATLGTGTGTGTGTITDDDAAPTVTLALADDSISENGGSTTVSATLSHPSSAATTITIEALADAYTVGADATIAIAAGNTANASDTATINAVDNETGEADRSVSVTGSATNTQGIGRVTGASLTLEDDDGGAGPTGSQDPQLPMVSVNSPSVAEGNSGTTTMTFRLTLSAASSEGKESVRYRDAGTGTATAGTDYVALATTDTTFDGVDYAAVGFAAGATTATINVTVNGDTVGEADETIVLILSDPDDTVTLDATSATGTITNDNGSTLAINSPSVAEGDSGSANLTYTVSLTPASAQQVTVRYADAGTGTATSGTDYTAISGGTLTFPAMTTIQTFDVSVTGDTQDEADETIVVNLSNAQNAAIATASGTGTITDDDDPPTVSVAAASVTEGDSGSTNLTFTATLSAASGKQVTVAWAEGTGGTATSGTDYTAITGGTLTFAAGTTSQTFNVSVTGDVVDESNETVVVTLSSPTNATISATAGSATGTITDNDATPTSITLTVNDDSVGEGDGDTTITVTATVDGTTRFGVDKTVSVSVAGSGTASAVDFAAVSDFDITIAAGAASGSETFTLSPTDDSVDETDETITVSGTSTGLTINPDTITLSDDDDTPSITLTVDDSSVAENDGATTITVTATVDGATRFVDDTTVEVSVAGSGTAAAVDFAAVSSFNISIGAGEASGTETFTLTPTDDTVHEANETITVSGTSGALTVNSATITLTDDEALPTVALSLSPTSVGEAGGASTVTATLSAESSAAVTLTVGAAAGTGAVAADFALSTAKTLTIAAGATTSTGTVTVTAVDNDVDAANKSVTVSATVTGGNGVAAPSDVTLTLTDDDTAGVTFNPTTLTVTEQGASQSFTVVLDSEPTGGINGTTWVGLTPSPSDAELDLNTALTYPYNLSFDTSNWDTPKTVAVTAFGDSDRANDTKQIRYTVAGYTGGEVTNQLAVTVTVIDDDKPAVSLSLSSSSISENGGVATVTATLDEAVTVATTVTVAAAAGTDTDASDFTLSSANTLTIAAGNTTSSGTVTITAVDNALDEPDKSVTVSGTVSHDGVSPPTARTLTITDDDSAPMLSINSPSVTEGDSGSTDLTFTATLSAASGREVTVDYADAGTGTATSGTDYTAITAGTLTFAAGTTSQTFNVSVTGDALDEADETVKVRLKDPVNAAVSTTAGTGTGTITDDDATPTLSISTPSVAEGDSGSTALTYTVTLSAASGRQVTVDYADAGTGTATSGTDYTAITGGTLTFAAGTTSRTFSVSVTGDTVDEPNETVVVNWRNAANATISSRSGVVANALRVDGTITDDDGAPDTITLTVDDADVGEGDGATTITVTATVDGTTRFGVDKTVRVSVSASGTTGNVVDFATVPAFDIGIAAGAASGTATFTLTPTDDTEDETDETITVSGTSTGLTVNPDTISLTDDDGTTTSITLTVDDTSVGEGDGATTITVTATLNGTGRFIDPKTVQVSVAGSGTAGAVDFAAVTAFDITIAARAASGAATFTLTPTDDVVDETDETITVRGTSSGLTVNSATISLTDNDAAPTAITLTVSNSSVGEGAGATSITVTATVDGTTRFAEAKTVRVSVAGSGTAGAVDFAAVEAFDIEIAAGAASDTAGFTLTPTDDAVDETNETITVRGTSSGLTVNSATITLTDDDGAPTSITLTVDDSSVGEGDGAATITVTATVDGTMRFAAATTVTVSVAGSGTATAVDFAAVSSFDITIPAGAASRTGSFTLTPTNDAVDETDETVTVSGSSGSLTVNAATITLTDNDAAPTSSITLTVSDNSVSEGDGATTITVTATVDGTTRFAAATTVEVLVRGTSGTATAVDFAAVSLFEIVIAAGAASGASDFTLTPTNDVLDETDETVTVYGASPGLTVSSATITLTDDDATPTAITLTVDDNSVAEDDGATTITVTATVDGGTRFIALTTVTVSVAGSGTATAVDFAAVSDFDIEINASDASGTATFTLTPTNDAFDETNETITVSGTSGSLTVSSATITLTDDDDAPAAITLTVDDNSVAEDDGATTITVTATVDGASRFVDATTVTVSVAGSGTATAVDFGAVSDFDITIAAGEASKTGTFTLTPTNDVVDETNETVTVSGSSGALTVNSATITLTDDDDAPTAITLTVNDNSVAEDDGATTITVTATVDGTTRFAAATTVQVSVAGSGTATAVDFAAVSNFNITIAAEAASANNTFTLTPTDDAVDETDETVTVSGSSGSLTVNSATITLTDDDAAPTAITLTVNPNSVAENDGATTITVTATVDGTTRFVAATTVTVSVGGSGTASAVDFAAVSDFDITIAAGDASKTGTFTLTPTDDAVDETNETVTVSGESGSLTVNSATITLTDDDAAPTAITLTVNDNSVAENDGATTITVTATVDGTTRFAAATTVTVSVGGSGTATAVDFASVSDFDITIAAGAQSEDETFTLTPTNDAVDETDETITVSGTSGSLTVNSATITLTDDDDAPTAITLTVNDNSVAEDDGATTITVTATVDGTTRFAAATTVTVSVGGSGTATAVDFAAVTDFDITIAAEAASANNTFTLTPTDDVVDETNETVTVSGESGSLTVNSATITLTDDDATPSITLTVDDNSVAEDDGATEITVTATVDGTTRFAAATTVTVSVSDSSTATAVDFAAVSDFDITIAAEAASGTSDFTLTPTNDVVDETNETVEVSGESGSLTVNSATITLTDDDDAPTAITLTVDDNSVGEGDGAATITVTATVDGTTRFATATTVEVSVAGSGTATAVDFAAVTDFDIEIAAGGASKTGTFTLTPTDDVVDETDETVTVSGESGDLTVNSATITLTDDDAAPTAITLTVDDDGVGEGDGATTITVTATVDGTTRFAAATTVTVSVAGSGTAMAVDFAAVSDFDIEIAAGAESQDKTFTLTPTDDAVDETDETITVGGTSGSLTVNSATISLTDDDDAPTSITLTVDDNSVGEGDGATTITVKATVDGGTRFAEATTVRVNVAGSGTDTAVDFAAVSSFDIEIAAGAESEDETFTLTPTDDAVDETNETITVSGESGSLTVNSATISLTDDDAAPTAITLTVDDNSVGEGDGATTITVTATVDGGTRFAAATTVTVSVTGSGTASAVDFAAVSDFDIEIAAEAASKAGTFTLTPTDDTADETDETVTVSGTSGSLTVNSATITLTDDDGPPSLSLDSPRVTEGDSGTTNLTFKVLLSPASGQQVTVNYADAGTGTATSGTDYTALPPGTLNFAAGTISQTFHVSVTGDIVEESNETVVVTLSSATNATISATAGSGTGTIVDDDAPPPSDPPEGPSFEFEVPDRTWQAGRAIEPLRLPQLVRGGARLTYSLTPELPAGLTLDLAARTITGTPTGAPSAREYRWTATDPGGRTTTHTFRITVLGEDPAFEFEVPDRTWREGSAIEPLRLPQLVGGSAGVSYSLTPEPPAGLVLDLAGRTITGTPTTPQSAREYRWAATDPGGDAVTDTFRITVLEDHQPSFEAVVGPGQLFGEFRFPVGREITPEELPSAEGGDGLLTYAVTPALPPGLTFSPGSRTLSGAPTEARERAIHVLTATDEDGDTASLSFAVTTIAIPMVMEIRIVSRPAAEGTYRYGEQIELEAEFSAPVTVAGSASLGLTVGERVRRASLFGGSGAVLRFRYTVGATDRDGDGVSVAANALALGGAESAEVDLSHAPLPDQPGHRVDGSPQAVGTLPALTLTLGGEPARVAVEDAFHAAFRYAARSSAPEVAAVSLEDATVVVSAVADGVATVTVTGTNAGGSAEQRFEVTVMTARAEMEVVEHALAGLGRSLLTSASATVGRRLMAGGGGGRRSEGGESEGGETETVTFSGLPTDDRLRLEEALRTSRNFTLSATQGGRRWTIWGAGDLQSFEGEAGPGSSYSGQPLNSWLGGWMCRRAGCWPGCGVAEHGGDGVRIPGSGDIGVGATGVWRRGSCRRIRICAGLRGRRGCGPGRSGPGTAKLSRSVTGATEEGSLRLLVGLAGVRRELGTAGGTALALRADLGGARLQAEAERECWTICRRRCIGAAWGWS